MVQIDLAAISVREANEKIREYGAQGERIDILNPDARHHIGVGLISPVDVHVHGSAGYFCGGLTDQARFEVDANVGWGVGSTFTNHRTVSDILTDSVSVFGSPTKLNRVSFRAFIK